MGKATAKLRPADDVSWQPMGQGQPVVVLRLTDGQLYSCNETAAALLSAADGGRTFAEIVTELCGQYEVSREQLEADLSEVVSEMLAEKLLVREQ
ncbi:MAG: PqqD family protein [Phycisphaerae bacterium]